MSQAQPSEVLYPNNDPVTSQPTTSTSSSHSNGSYAPVFAVLAVILVISAIACVLGQFCNRRRHRSKEGGHHKSKGHKQQSHHGLGPKEWESKQKPSYDMNGFGDIELGFGKGSFAGQKGGKNGGKDKPTHKNGGHKNQVKFDDDFSGI